MDRHVLFRIILTSALFLLLFGIVVLILNPVFALLYFILLAFVFVILWLKNPAFHEAIAEKLRSSKRKVKDVITSVNDGGDTPIYDNQFVTEYELVENRHGRVRRYPITKEEFIIGRDPSCDLVITGDNTVARKHCRIVYRKYSHVYYIEDLRSMNGTYLGTRRLEPFTQEKLLTNADVLISNRAYRFEKAEQKN